MSEHDEVTNTLVVRQLGEGIRELERHLGRQTLQAQILCEALDKSPLKKPTLAPLSPRQGDFR